jgi:putative membrane protein
MRNILSAIAAFTLPITLALGCLGAPASAQDKESQRFMTEAIEGNFAEVAMGQLAQQKGQTSAVKSYGQMLVNDHEAANQKAQQAAGSVGVAIPPTGPDAKQKAENERMTKLSDRAFDRQFARAMVKDHKEAIATYEKAAKKTDAAGKYAKETLPTLEKHLKSAETLERQSNVRR